MEKKKYISDEEHEKCRRVAEAFAELEDVDIVVVDVGRYGDRKSVVRERVCLYV